MSRYRTNLLSECVEDCHVGVSVVDVVDVGRVLAVRPLLRNRRVHVEHDVVRLALVVHRVEPDQLGM